MAVMPQVHVTKSGMRTGSRLSRAPSQLSQNYLPFSSTLSLRAAPSDDPRSYSSHVPRSDSEVMSHHTHHHDAHTGHPSSSLESPQPLEGISGASKGVTKGATGKKTCIPIMYPPWHPLFNTIQHKSNTPNASNSSDSKNSKNSTHTAPSPPPTTSSSTVAHEQQQRLPNAGAAAPPAAPATPPPPRAGAAAGLPRQPKRTVSPSPCSAAAAPPAPAPQAARAKPKNYRLSDLTAHKPSPSLGPASARAAAAPGDSRPSGAVGTPSTQGQHPVPKRWAEHPTSNIYFQLTCLMHAHDPFLCQAYEAGQDLHRLTASRQYSKYIA